MTPDELYAWWQETYPTVMEELTGMMERLPK
jgi:predicted choloylglycine hydrolase